MAIALPGNCSSAYIGSFTITYCAFSMLQTLLRDAVKAKLTRMLEDETAFAVKVTLSPTSAIA